jgi:hypothetical protein
MVGLWGDFGNFQAGNLRFQNTQTLIEVLAGREDDEMTQTVPLGTQYR